MPFALFALSVVGFILLVSEFLWRKKIIAGEYGRKLVHMSMGMFVASWPYFMNMRLIQLIACAAIVTLILSRKFKIFHAIHDVSRITYGEILYPLSILIIALLAHADWIFAMAVLFVAIPDGMAALVGRKWGKKHTKMKMWNHDKTIIGTCTYIVFAYLVIGAGLVIGGSDTILANSVRCIVLLPLVAAFFEAASPYGLDNVTVPLLVVLSLNALAS